MAHSQNFGLQSLQFVSIEGNAVGNLTHIGMGIFDEKVVDSGTVDTGMPQMLNRHCNGQFIGFGCGQNFRSGFNYALVVAQHENFIH